MTVRVAKMSAKLAKCFHHFTKSSQSTVRNCHIWFCGTVKNTTNQGILYTCCTCSGNRLRHETRRFLHTQLHDFQPKRVLLMRKITRYEYEKLLTPNITESALKERIIAKGSDYQGLLQRHDEYFHSLDQIQQTLVKHKIDYRLIRRFDYGESLVEWADMILTAGGDGTFLMAASKVTNSSVPVVGINTDPVRSEGYLCLPKEYSFKVDDAITKIMDAKFKWKWRQRIRITMSGRHASDFEAVDLQRQRMDYPEYRYWEHVREHETHKLSRRSGEDSPPRVLPVLALNEVFIGESLSARMSFYEMAIDDKPFCKQKSSGITVCTGTGSTSWFFNINHMTKDSVAEVLRTAQKHGACCDASLQSDSILEKVTEELNSSLRFNPVHPKMAYTVRDPVSYGIFQVARSKGFCKRVQVRSRMWDAWVVVDGSLSFRFNDGAIVDLSVHDEDALRCLELEES